jgi:ATP-binding cassette subfamily F protein uup
VNLISIDNASKTLGDSPLFAELSLGIDEGDRLGLVGHNGAGKSTLLKVLSGGLETDSGTIARKRGLAVSVLGQRPLFRPGSTLRDFLRQGESTGIEVFKRYEALVASGAHSGHELDSLHRHLEATGDLDLEHRFLSLCDELGLADDGGAMDSFSGGMLKKAAIARALAPKSDFVLLDEPTNHLDIETIEWLEKRLLGGGFAFILVTHDRWFLDSVCSSILEIERGRVFRHEGNYSAYLEGKAERWAQAEKADSKRLAKLKIELEWMGRGARARAGKSRRRKEKVREMAQAGIERTAGMEGFGSTESRLGRKVLELRKVSKGYDGRSLFSDFSYEFSRGDRIGVVGPNGIGKTSLLDLLVGRREPDSGSVIRGDTLKLAYFDQQSSSLDETMTVLDCVREKAEILKLKDGVSLTAEQLLERFLFPRLVQGLAISRLSGGERRRLELVRLLAESPNFLILDEPTNDLDIETIELLEDFLESFQGCVVSVSHDRAFLDRIASFLLVFEGEGRLREFPGSYSEWRELQAEEEEAALAARREEGPRRESARPTDVAGDKKKLSWAERKEFDGLLGAIDALEAEKAALEAYFGAANHEAAGLEKANRRYAELGELIEGQTRRWEELAERE